MSRETNLVALLKADTALVALLPGGIYTDEELGLEGIRRGEDSPTTAAFDADGYLLPCVVVREDDIVEYGGVTSLGSKFTGVSQMVYLFFYQNRGHDQIMQAKERSYQVLQGERLGRSFPIWWSYDSSPIADVGPVKNATVIRQDWQCISTRRGE